MIVKLGTFDAERIKQGPGLFIWMKAGEDDEGPSERARYEGNYKDGIRSGFGKMTYPNGDIYEGEWLDNKVMSRSFFSFVLLFFHLLVVVSFGDLISVCGSVCV